MKNIKFIKSFAIVVAAVALVLVNCFFLIPLAHAGTLTMDSIVETGTTGNANPMIEGDPQEVSFEFTPATTTGVNPTINLTFTGWTGSTAGIIGTSGSQTFSTSTCTTLFPSTPTAIPGTLAASSTPGSGILTVASTGGSNTLNSGTTYCGTFTFASAVTNPTATGGYSVTINDGTDSQIVGIDVLSSGANAYSITGTVAPTFTMALSGATDTFASNLTSSAVVVSTGITTTINTNAKSGWFVWAMDSNAGLTSTQASTTIPTESTGSNHTMNGGTIGTAEYAFGAVAGTNSPTILSNYAYGAGTTGGGLSNSTFNEIASHNVPASGDTFITHELADISATTPPATDYTDTITEIGAGSF